MLEIVRKKYRLCIDEVSKRFVFFGTKENLLSEKQPPLFALRLVDNHGRFSVYTAEDAKSVKADQRGEELRLVFDGFEIPMTVTLMAKLPLAGGLSYWQIKVDCDRLIDWAEYPCVSVRDGFGQKGDSRLLYPYNEGALISDVDARERTGWGYREPQYPSQGNYGMYPGMVSTPLLAVSSSSGGIYLAAHDPQKNTRHVDFHRYEDGVRLRFRLYPGCGKICYTSDFETVLGYFEGDWYVAAELYRQYLRKEARLTPLAKRGDLPKWYHSSPVVIAYAVRGHHDTDVMDPNAMFPYVNGLKVLDRLSQELDSPIMALLMHWEGTAPWAPPYVWPPYGGEESLRAFVDAMHERGNAVGLYCSGLGWTQESNIADYTAREHFDRERLSDVMCVAPDGSLPLSKICTSQRSGYDLCPATDFCRDTLTHEVNHMAKIGVDYIQLLDQNHGGTPYFCYSGDHGHPPVPGKWQSEAMNDILAPLHESYGKQVLFGCESAAAEPFLNHLLFSDNRYELNFMLGKPIPLYSYLYHPYVNNFMGNQVCLESAIDCKKSRDNLLYRLAYSFIAGDMLTLVITSDGRIQWSWGQKKFCRPYMPTEDTALLFTKRLNAWRRAYPEYLVNGEMMPPPKELSIETLPLHTAVGIEEYPVILTACYEAADGKRGLFAVNRTEDNQLLRWTSPKGSTVRRTPNQSPDTFDNDIMEIPPLSIFLIEWMEKNRV